MEMSRPQNENLMPRKCCTSSNIQSKHGFCCPTQFMPITALMNPVYIGFCPMRDPSFWQLANIKATPSKGADHNHIFLFSCSITMITKCTIKEEDVLFKNSALNRFSFVRSWLRGRKVEDPCWWTTAPARICRPHALGHRSLWGGLMPKTHNLFDTYSNLYPPR